MLDEVVPFLEAPPLEPGQAETYILPQTSTESASLFEHCVRAIAHAPRYGAHGLPLMGSGDWNDGMNRVGHDGRGESVWLGWFLVAVLDRVRGALRSRAAITISRERYRSDAHWLDGMLELSWDGGWYRRAYFDDGTPLGSAQNEECRIDSLTQSWAVLSGAAQPAPRRQAMDAVRAHLLRRDAQIVLLLDAALRSHELTIPATSRATCRASARTADSTRTRRCGRCIALARLGLGDEAMELFHMLNPINHTRTPDGVERYQGEPYVVAADVYAHPMHVGRGGWTWYTGSAGWMYQAAIEGLLGLRRHGSTFSVNPSIPAMWPDLLARVDGRRHPLPHQRDQSRASLRRRGVGDARRRPVDAHAIPARPGRRAARRRDRARPGRPARAERAVVRHGAAVTSAIIEVCAPLAQLDRASGYEPGGRRFESCRARQPSLTLD